MLKIKVFSNDIPNDQLELVLPIIKKQMDFIGSKKTLEHIKKDLINAMKPQSSAVLFLGYEKKDIPISFAFGNIGIGLQSGKYFWLNEIYVDESYRSKGFASLFLSEIQAWLRHENIYYMASMTHEKNVASQNLFKKNGFDLDSIIWMDKDLTKK